MSTVPRKPAEPATRRRPTEVTNAIRIFWLALGIELLGYFLSGNYLPGVVISVLIGVALVVYLIRQTTARHNWARVALLVLTGLGLLTFTLGVRNAYFENPGETVAEAIATLLTIVASILLLSRESNDWFLRRRSSTTS